MAKNMERESITIEVEQSMMENGIKIENMDLESIPTLMAKNLKGTGLMEKNMAKEPISTNQDVNMLEIGSKIRRMVVVFLNLLMEESMMENGLMIVLQTRERWYILTRISMKEAS